MEQQQGCSSLSSSSSTNFLISNKEIQVCKILLNLKKLIRQYDTTYNVHWAHKMPRSSLRSILNPNLMRYIPIFSLSSPYTNTTSTEEEESETKSHSPDSPLCNLSTTPHILKQSHPKILKKRTREDLVEQLEGLEQDRKKLRGALENMKDVSSKLKAENLEFKQTRKQLQFPSIENQLRPQDVDGYRMLDTDPEVQKRPSEQISRKDGLVIDLNAPAPLD